MDFCSTLLSLAIILFATTTILASEENNNATSEKSPLINLLTRPVRSANYDDSSLEDLDDSPSNLVEYGLPVVAPPVYSSVGAIGFDARGLLAPHVEILRLIESFIKLKGEVLARLKALIADNWDLIRAVFNLVSGKISKLQTFSLVGVSVIRRILEFAVQLFGQWQINLPSIAFGVNTPVAVGSPLEYGLPPALGPAIFRG